MRSPRSVYVHFPFCVQKCPYCDFVSYPVGSRHDRDSADCSAMDGYIDGILREIEATARIASEDGLSILPLETVYLGGGTPSLFAPEEIGRVLATLRECFGILPDAEISMEANPGTVSESSLTDYRSVGVSRISMGVQSLSDGILRRIGRIYSGAEAVASMEAALRAGFLSLSCDLMTGLPGQTAKDAMDSLEALIRLGVPHISFYALSLEEGTPFYDRYASREELLPSQESEREMHHRMLARLAEAGYKHYEISNCALPGHESRHNRMYWKALPYYGLGAGAHSYFAGKRRANSADVGEYLAADGSALGFQSVEEEVDLPGEKREFMLLGFRLLDGVSAAEYKERFGSELCADFGSELRALETAGYLKSENGCYRIRKDRLDFANEVFRGFVG